MSTDRLTPEAVLPCQITCLETGLAARNETARTISPERESG
jgi:hypothetical protein